MEKHISFYQRCTNQQCNFYYSLIIPLSNNDNDSNCVLNKGQQQQKYSFVCPKCKMVTLLNFEEIALLVF